MRPLRGLLLCGAAVLALGACAAPRANMPAPDYSSMPQDQALGALAELNRRYEADPRDKGLAVHYAAALRANGQPERATSVLETGMGRFPGDRDVGVAYAKALTEAGRLDQALNVIDNVLRPDVPDWEALSVKGAIYDQLGRNAEARQLYARALTIAPHESALEANMGLSYAMTNELDLAERHLRRASEMPGATSRVRQNLALVLGLQGRFEAARAIYAAELPPDQVEANMAYVRGLLSQQNRWDAIAGAS